MVFPAADFPPAARVLRTAAGVLLLLVLVVAPLNFGSTRPAAFHVLIAGGALVGALWLTAMAIARPALGAPPVLLFGAALCAVVALAWLLLPPPSLPGFTAHHLSRVTARWPTSMVPRGSALLIVWALVALLLLFVAWDLARDSRWRYALAATMVAAGTLAALLGLLQNATHARGIYWQHGPRMPGMFFGPFYHHTSAGAYLNSVWPLAAALGLHGLRGDTARARRGGVLFGLATLILFAAHLGHVSRLPQVIAAVVLLVLMLWLRPWRRRSDARPLRWALAGAAVLVTGGVFAFGAGRVDTIRARWSQLELPALLGRSPASTPPAPPQDWPRLMRGDLFVKSDHGGYPLGDRGAAYAVAWCAILDRPWLGWGPGGWTAAAAAHSLDPFVRTFFLYLQFTHNDYLQTCVEWGLPGAAGWALVAWGAVFFALRRLGSHPGHDLCGAAAAAALVALFAQSLVDFPLQIPALQLNATVLAALAWSTPAAAGAPASDLRS